MSKRHINFFGASVTAQSVHHATKETTGFVNWFEELYSKELDAEISRVSAGSCTIEDAGIVYVEKVVSLRPDVCVLDWLTPNSTDCDLRILEHIYARLIKSDIFPITIILPRRDRVQTETPLAKKMKLISEMYDMPLYDFSYLIHGLGENNELLRDLVHTTSFGGKLYSEKIFEKIVSDIDRKFSANPPNANFFVSEVICQGKIPEKCTNIFVYLDKYPSEEIELSLILEQRVGPYSPIVNVVAGSNRMELSIWDRWCARERRCIKVICPWTKGEFEKIEISVSPSDPVTVDDNKEVFSNKERYIRPSGKLYIVSDKPCSAIARYGNEPGG